MEKVLLTEHFDPVSNGDNLTNIPNIETVAYRFTVPNGWLFKLNKKQRMLMKITGWFKASGVNTTGDFTVTAPAAVAVVRDQDGNIRHDLMAIARGRSSNKIFTLASYNATSKELTFSGGGGTSSEDVDVFYLIGEGYVRFQLTSPAQATRISTSIFTSSLQGVNSKYQLSKNDALFVPFEIEAREAFSFELAVNTPATVLFDARLIPAEGSFTGWTTNWNTIGYLEIPVYIVKLTTAEAMSGQNMVQRTNAQLQ